MTGPKIVTIGVYGFSEEQFFQVLRQARVDVFCDVRMRRGLRGREYAFANSRHLQAKLREMGMEYKHLKELAPTPAIRELQKRKDKETGTGQRERTKLGPEFLSAYSDLLNEYDAHELLNRMGEDAKVIALRGVAIKPSRSTSRYRLASHYWAGLLTLPRSLTRAVPR